LVKLAPEITRLLNWSQRITCNQLEQLFLFLLSATNYYLMPNYKLWLKIESIATVISNEDLTTALIVHQTNHVLSVGHKLSIYLATAVVVITVEKET